MTFEEIRKLHQHKIPARKEAEHILAKNTPKGAELGSVMFLETLKVIRGDSKGITDNFLSLYRRKKIRLYDSNQAYVLSNWEAFTDYISHTHKTIYYQQIIVFLGIAKLTDTIKYLFETPIKTKTLVEVLPKQWFIPISDAIQFCLGWNTFIKIACDYFGIQQKIQKELTALGLDSLLGFLRTPKIKEAIDGVFDNTFNWQELEEKTGIKAKQLHETLAQVKELTDIKPPTQEKIKTFTENWYKAIEAGNTRYYFYDYCETMLLMFYR